MDNVDNLILEAIEKDTIKEYTVPLNDEGSFINSHFFEEWIKEATITVTVTDHNPDNGVQELEEDEEEDLKKCEDWLIELKADNEHFSKEVKLGEEASFKYLVENIPATEDGIDEIELVGAHQLELAVTAIDEGCELSIITIEVS